MIQNGLKRNLILFDSGAWLDTDLKTNDTLNTGTLTYNEFLPIKGEKELTLVSAQIPNIFSYTKMQTSQALYFTIGGGADQAISLSASGPTMSNLITYLNAQFAILAAGVTIAQTANDPATFTITNANPGTLVLKMSPTTIGGAANEGARRILGLRPKSYTVNSGSSLVGGAMELGPKYLAIKIQEYTSKINTPVRTQAAALIPIEVDYGEMISFSVLDHYNNKTELTTGSTTNSRISISITDESNLSYTMTNTRYALIFESKH